MIEIGVQANNLNLLREAVKSNCNKIRFGSEFCMFKVPDIDELKAAYLMACQSGKSFTYLLPRLSDVALESVQKHFDFLNSKGEITIVINDLGALEILKEYPNLKPNIGRQLVYMPARCPWSEAIEFNTNFFSKHKIEEIFYQTSLNYKPTTEFFKYFGVQGADVDWIPKCFPHFGFIIKNGINLSVHLHLIPATITRKCHMARFLREENLEHCSRLCDTKTFRMENDALGIELFLSGNAIFQFVKPEIKDLKQLKRLNISELIITMSSINEIETQQEIDKLIGYVMQF